MARSFLLIARDSNVRESIILSECHVNLWFFTRRAITIEFGFILEVPANMVVSGRSFDLELHTASCPMGKHIVDLGRELARDEMMRTLFNKHVTSRRQVSPKDVPVPQVLQRFSFQGREPIILFSPNVSVTPDPQVYGLRYDMSAISASSASITESSGPVHLYSRFRYEIDVKRTPGIERPAWPRNDTTYIDIRVNEPRTSDIAASEVLRQREAHVFVIAPTRYYLSDFGTRLRHVRLLEKEIWRPYVAAKLPRNSEYLVYKWKQEFNLEEGAADRFYLCLLLSSARTEVKNLLLLTAALVSVLVLSCFDCLLEKGLVHVIGWFSSIWLSLLAGGVVVVALVWEITKGLVGDFLKSGVRKLQKQKDKR